jgi:hypothetical protein
LNRAAALGFLLFAVGGVSRADEVSVYRPSERLSVEKRFLPFSHLKNPPQGTPLADARIQPDDTRVRFSFPAIRFPAHKASLVPSISYQDLHFNYRGWNSGYEPDRVDELQSIGVSALYRRPLSSPRWSLGWLASGSLASDFKVINWSSMRFQGAAFATRKVAHGNVSMGLALLNNYGRPRVFPLIGFDSSPGAVHKWTLRLPVEASYFYCPPKKWEVGVAARISGMNARITQQGEFQGKNVAYSVATVGPSLRWKFSSALALSLEAGWVPFHRFQILDNGTKIRDYDMSTPYFISTGLRLSL